MFRNHSEKCSVIYNALDAFQNDVSHFDKDRKFNCAKDNFRLPSEKQQILPPSMKQSRSVKEYEEQMSELRKENFNLKLRLYFLEENIPGYQANNIEGTENLVMKQLLDAKVEMESLRGEIQEKQNLLKEAIKAMNKMEEERSYSEARAFETIAELKNRLDFQEHDCNLTLFRSTNALNTERDFSAQAQKIKDLEDRLKQSENKLADFQDQINKLDDILTQRDNTIEEYEEKMKNLIFKNDQQMETINDMEMELLNTQKILEKTCDTNASLKQDNEKLLRTLRCSTEHFNNEAINIEICEKQMQEQQEALCKMQSTISVKTANTARLLLNIQEYEKMVAKMNFERNLVKRENQFFRCVIDKLRKYKNPMANDKNDIIYKQKYNIEGNSSDINLYLSDYKNSDSDKSSYKEYNKDQNLIVNFSNEKLISKAIESEKNGIYIHKRCNVINDNQLPIRLTISEENFISPSQLECFCSFHGKLMQPNLNNNSKNFLKE